VAAELKRDFGAQTKLVKSSGGVFEVEVDGAVVYSKIATGRFPHPGEVAKAIPR
jgi:selT/selW/selH-like putative selenoprotein